MTRLTKRSSGRLKRSVSEALSFAKDVAVTVAVALVCLFLAVVVAPPLIVGDRILMAWERRRAGNAGRGLRDDL